ncbi:MAG TPA: M23 family metallopeptidase [Gracilimonas sp.]|uniref:M23 family metallopeptidase n=1 Tax=Gracilimonas sp. TaxID=1974203 RepID=UPI002D8994D1|nr:M23 family metallopeptidase [Gracilimonas sp.]
MKTFLFLLLLFSSAFLQHSTTVELYKEEKEDHIEIYARNQNVYPVTIEIELEIENLRPDKNPPYLYTVDPGRDQKIMDLFYEDKSAGWKYRSGYQYYMGDINARHNNSFAYRLPYHRGESYKVDQGFGGQFSHQGELQYALDFNMPMGTAIYAARNGKVVMMEENSDKGGPSANMMEFANFITIMHDDGTFADYSHLKYQGANVRIGQQVQMGQVIGYSGATGYATGPHLHFVVKKTKRGGGFTSIPVKFATKDGIIQLREGDTYIGY